MLRKKRATMDILNAYFSCGYASEQEDGGDGTWSLNCVLCLHNDRENSSAWKMGRYVEQQRSSRAVPSNPIFRGSV